MTERSSVRAETLPYWTDSASLPSFPKLERDRDVDVVVIGGGITGLTTAYLVASSGRAVVLLERGRCGEIDTGHTSAHLTMVTDVRLGELVNRFGRAHAQAVWDAGLAGIAEIEAIVAAHRIDCGFEWVDGYLHAPVGEVHGLDAERFANEAALANELGFDATFAHDVPFVEGPGVKFERQARFHPRKYLAGLVAAIRQKGGAIHEHSAADEFLAAPIRVKTNGHVIRCRDIAIATHNPIAGLADTASAALFQTKLALYTSYVVAARAPRGSVPDALYWDTADPYRYLRIANDGDVDLVLLGGEDHKTGQVSDTNACYERLERALMERLPGASPSHRWSGQVIETPDGLPYIGRVVDHQYAATGFAGNGMTFGTIAARMIADGIQGRSNPWEDLFAPTRTALRRGLWDYLKENADYPYYMIRSRFAGAEGRSLRSVKRGEGKIVDDQGRKLAAYRDERGTLTVRSATCTHMGCLVAWNEAERTWDCPCHGSRFTPAGEVLSGPAESPLATEP